MCFSVDSSKYNFKYMFSIHISSCVFPPSSYETVLRYRRPGNPKNMHIETCKQSRSLKMHFGHAGLDTRAKTKEDYMFRRAQDRIRTYFYKTKEDLLKTNNMPINKVHILLNDLSARLKNVKHFGCYFDRSAAAGDKELKSLCDDRGVFMCQGRWDRERCLYTPTHQINPYTSREERIIFQTWNLDHTVERARAVIPAIFEALKQENLVVKENDDTLDIDVKSIFNDLFTVNNLKFVHIVCHDKGAHFSKKAGPYYLL